MTQVERLEQYLKTHGSVEPLTAWRELGIYRLAAVVLLLKKKGYSIRTERLEVENQFQEKCKVANYVLEQAPKESTNGNASSNKLQDIMHYLRSLTEELRHDNDKAEQRN